MPDPFSVCFTVVKVTGFLLALTAMGYLIFDNLFLRQLGRRTVIRLVIDGKVSKREIVRLLEERGYKVVRWK
ncbi:hypothetical protein [Archaeoglobus profundus]|uniref:Uncharacterized protein n=1 Tax=Archaeoglobus profundus (strain DSM 5631 / JCM 9629 / NBRC 100127 / Av18) TaxID=572546 RepID=D2RI00_ARCPA|nr:hypothetical protein [Archaeoglobus profundus]ADB57925.1 hypothetical protein Arcpr_0862 [Archaeoglobus profundus DSM 5631]